MSFTFLWSSRRICSASGMRRVPPWVDLGSMFADVFICTVSMSTACRGVKLVDRDMKNAVFATDPRHTNDGAVLCVVVRGVRAGPLRHPAIAQPSRHEGIAVGVSALV